MSYGGAILFPDNHTGKIFVLLQSNMEGYGWNMDDMEGMVKDMK
jgi:hypothetical protein